MSFFRNFCRIITGLVFILSGFVKGVDPWGTAFKFEDYFLALNMEWATGYTMFLAILLISAEFILGWMLLFNLKTKLGSWLVLLFMLLFTPLTLWLAIDNKISDCGCFGDFLIMNNWTTFIKNLVILIFVFITFFLRKKYNNKMSGIIKFLVFVLGVGILTFTMTYGYRHLPLFDFRPYKVGEKISKIDKQEQDSETVYLKYINTETGDTLVYTTKTLPYQDSVFYNKLEFLEQIKKEDKTESPDESHSGINLYLTDIAGNDFTSKILGNSDFQFMLIIYDLNKTNKGYYKDISDFYESCRKYNIDFCAAIGATWEDVDVFRAEIGADFDIYAADPTELKTIIRSNPGLMLLKNGYVMEKWHYNDIPKIEDIHLRGSIKAFAAIENDKK